MKTRYVSVLDLQEVIAKKWNTSEWYARQFIHSFHPMGRNAEIIPHFLVRTILGEVDFTKEEIDNYVENNCNIEL